MIDGFWATLIEIGFFLFMVSFFGFVGWTMWSSRKDGRNAEQLKELIRFAQQRGWAYADVARSKRGRYFTGKVAERVFVYDFGAYDFITGTFRGRTFRCFELRSRPASPDGPESTKITVTFELELPMAVPLTTIKRRRPLDTVGARFFANDKVVELGLPVFDKTFRVMTEDEDFARHALSGALAQFLATDPRAPSEPLLLSRNVLSTTYTGRLRVEQVDAKLNYLSDVLDRLPAQSRRVAEPHAATRSGQDS
ncbi:hypothetical protein ADL22_22060 [Streptomyces sp. NRRL F-4489]|uniref:hypothetical protein n=1 Tax=Streptomyces sp. NRRL F-4489 TaxID=1609095 RepID=UPI00074AFC92|nr:hypothetical protein [Streptomyces sp. NRRL F-4489]KUL37258.1 hypothetical protein ADL22_22060 [Streptomyces sp. NRRL F-4489]